MAEQSFGVDRVVSGDTLVMRIRGDIDLATAGRLAEELRGAVAQAPVVVADLSGVSFVDSTGVRALVEAYRAAEKAGHRFYAEGAQNWVAKVLEVTGVGPLLTRP